MKLDNNFLAFLALAQAGLWEREVRLIPYGHINYKEIYSIAESQLVVGLVAAGIEHVIDVTIPHDDVLLFVGHTLQLEQRNVDMNRFIGSMTRSLRANDICSLLLKGQGIALCYERPLWRTSGDVDLLLSDRDYNKTKNYLLKLSSRSFPERIYSKELGMVIKSWMVEVHGTQRIGLSSKIDRVIDSVQHDVFYGDNVRTWDNDGIPVFMPSPDNDVFFVFTHYLKHYYKDVLNLRQVCDWCRLLWEFRGSLDLDLLKKRLRESALLSEWKAFSALAVDYLGIPKEAMPFYVNKHYWHSKALRIVKSLNTNNEVRRLIHCFITFPWHTLKFMPNIMFNVNILKIIERVSI